MSKTDSNSVFGVDRTENKPTADSFSIIQDLQEEDEVSPEWIGDYEISHAYDLRFDKDFYDSLHSRNDRHDDTSHSGKLVVPHKRFAVLWMLEISGQISDGAWENYLDNESWQTYCYAELVVDEDQDKIHWDSRNEDSFETIQGIDVYSNLTEYEGLLGRMLFFVRMTCDMDSYTVTDLRKDLRKLNNAI